MKLTKESIFLIFCFFFSLIPFVAFQWKWDGYELPKYFFVILFGIISGIIILFTQKIKLPNKSVLYYLIFFTISTLFSSNFLYSFFGDYPRLNQSFLLILAILLISIVYVNYLSSLNIFKIIFVQALFLNLITFFENNERVFSTFGQPNYLGIILVLGIIYSFENSLRNKLFHISSVFLLIGLIKTASITSILGLVIYFIFFIFNAGRKYWKYFLPAILIITISISVHPITKEKITDNYNLLFNNNSETKITDSIRVRFSIWEDSLKIIFSNPKVFLIGTGPETFSLYYEEVKGNKINQTSEWNSLIDKPHNFFLEILIEEGLLGLIIFTFVLYKFFQSNSEEKNYMIIILVYLFFNWAHVFLQLIMYLILIRGLSTEEYFENSLVFKSHIIIFFLINFIALRFFQFEEMSPVKNYYLTNNPLIKMNGLEYYQNKNELKQFLIHLKNKYPNNLKIQFEIYKSEKLNNFLEQEATKNKIKELRPDLIIWNETLR